MSASSGTRSFRRLTAFLDSRLRSGRIEVIDWAGNAVTCGPQGTPLAGSVHLHSRRIVPHLIADPGLAVGTAFANGDWDVRSGNLVDIILTLRRDIPPSDPFFLRAYRIAKRAVGAFRSRGSEAANIDFHYNIGNDFYQLWLDSDLYYSCAFFAQPEASLEQAQQEKARRIAAKLNLRPGDRVLDIGCGWGSMAFYLAQNFDVHVTGISLAERQVAFARAKAAAMGLANSTNFELCDYRSASGQYDAIVSIGMLEHVGKAHLPELFGVVQELLKPDGAALIHTIGSVSANPDPNPWIERYIFPGGYIPSLDQLASAVGRTALIVSDVETLRMHYAWTLKEWRSRLFASRREIAESFGERFFRMWDFYLAISEASFRAGIYVNYQIQLAKAVDALPYTRDYMIPVSDESSPAATEQMRRPHSAHA